MQRVLVIGCNGQVGSELSQRLLGFCDVSTMDKPFVDIGSPDSIRAVLNLQVKKPNIIVNAAAYTDVEGAENDSQRCYDVNTLGPRVLAEEAKKLGALLVHFSSDYVFSGYKHFPYNELDVKHPLNVYGKSKHYADLEIEQSGCRYLIYRLCWVYSPNGTNFIHKIIALAKDGKPIRATVDQFGCPTPADAIADAVAAILKRQEPVYGTYHLCSSGGCSRFAFAEEIVKYLPWKVRLEMATSEQFATAMNRPLDTRLSCLKLLKDTGVQLAYWEEYIGDVVKQILNKNNYA